MSFSSQLKHVLVTKQYLLTMSRVHKPRTKYSRQLIIFSVTCLSLKVCRQFFQAQHSSDLIMKLTVSVAIDPRVCHATDAHEKCCGQIN